MSLYMSILLQKKNVGDYSYMSSPNIYYRAYIKAMLLEEIEDEYDVSIVNEYIQEKDSMKFLTLEESSKEWDIK